MHISNVLEKYLNKLLAYLPMGSPGSPAYAICICMFYEQHFINKTLNKQNKYFPQTNNYLILFALRYIDDLLSFIAYDITKPQTKLFAQHILSKLQTSYHKNMKLKPENFNNNRTKFLETEIIYQPQNNNTDITEDKNPNRKIIKALRPLGTGTYIGDASTWFEYKLRV